MAAIRVDLIYVGTKAADGKYKTKIIIYRENN